MLATNTLRKVLLLSMIPGLMLLFTACSRPISFDVSSGPEHTLVMITGDTALSRIIWDAGLSSERVIPGGFFGGYMFSVPAGAAIGNHPVALEQDGSRSAILNFNVTAPQPFGAPRIDQVTIALNPLFNGGNVDTWLLVQGANLDVGSVVQFGGVDVATVAYKGLRNNLYGVAPNRLGYPIYHYVGVIADVSGRPAGSALNITVRNLDGQTSAPFSYTLPADRATLDSDGDGLFDSWEMYGYDADGDGTIDVNLPALGASRYRRDTLIEVDIMSDLANPPIATSGTTPGTFETMQRLFAAAPIVAIGPNNGINLILDTSGSVPFSQTVDLEGADSPMLGFANFYTLKAANFDNAHRGNIYHYAIWGNAMPGGYSGVSDSTLAPADANGIATGSGDDFLVSFESYLRKLGMRG